jgi:hypothetical protein
MYKKFGVPPDGGAAFVICAPSGESLAAFTGGNCTQLAVLRLLNAFKEYYAAWQKAHPEVKGR